MTRQEPGGRRGWRSHRATTFVAAAAVVGGVVLGGLARIPPGVPASLGTATGDPGAPVAPRAQLWDADGSWPNAAADPGEPSPPPSPGASAVQVRESGSGRLHPLTLPGRDSTRTGRIVRYTVEAENGLGVPTDAFVARVRRVLTDAAGWEVRDGVHFVHVPPGNEGQNVDMRIILGSPDLVDRACAPLRTNGRLSCHARGKVMINAWRWVHGAVTYGDDLDGYRTYLIGHEVGHALGHGHVPCPGKGRAAPLMLQQTLHLDGCRRWPHAVAP